MDTTAQLNDTQLLEMLKELYEDKLPFNRVLGCEVDRIDWDSIQVGFKMKPELIGNFVQRTLHGGVISAVLDATGGLMAGVGLIRRQSGRPFSETLALFSRVGTIDLRVDYLRPGRGQRFTAKATAMRTGRKVAVTRMELFNDQQSLIAVGTGTYMVG